MKSLGIVCEYNPFHNGHAYHIRRAREVSQCDAVVCVMSGEVVQRGEIALYDKWTRARWALQNGADLVVELPSYYVLQSADVFARGGVTLLNALGVHWISFGSESGDLAYVNRLAERMCGEDAAFRAALSAALSDGMGYPAAYARALGEVDPAFAVPPGANDLLGAAYLRALRECGSAAEPVVIGREGTVHDGAAMTGGFASASALRERLLRGEPVSGYVPWEDAPSCRDMQRLEPLILGLLRTCPPEELVCIPGMESGFQNRLCAAAREAATLDEFWDAAVTRRYTRSRVRRAVLCALLGIRQDMALDGIRVLGFTPAGARVLKNAKDSCPYPLVVKTADFTPASGGMLAADLRATDLAALCEAEPDDRRGGKDYTTSPVKYGF